MSAGAEQIKPKFKEMANVMMDCYFLGFKTCWKMLTGKDFDND